MIDLLADSYIRRKRWEYREQLSVVSDPMRGLDRADAETQPEPVKTSAPKPQPSAERIFSQLTAMGLGMTKPPGV